MKKRTVQKKESFWRKLKSYKLHLNVYVLSILIVLTIVSTVVFYYLYEAGDQGFLFNLMIAISTSLLASIFCMVSDMVLKYKECENDMLIKGLHEYGISNLHFDKLELLVNLMEDCTRECWISGYRLILTRKLIPSIEKAVKRGIKIRILVCPPWSNAYKSVYGSHDQTIDNYCKIFQAVLRTAGSAELAEKLCEVKFTDKPLFNDTYKVDDYLITGSYLHNRDKEYGRITASDFFCFDLERRSELYNLIHDEYLTLWDEATRELQWDQFEKIVGQYWTTDLRESERIGLIHDACREITPETSQLTGGQ